MPHSGPRPSSSLREAPLLTPDAFAPLPQLNKYLKLDQKGSLIAEYVWIDADGGTRAKARVSSLLRSLETFFLVSSALPGNGVRCTTGSWLPSVVT